MECIVFTTQQAVCAAAEAQISTNMHFPEGAVTISWATPEQRTTDGKWWIPKPEDRFMAGVPQPYTIEAFDPSWRA